MKKVSAFSMFKTKKDQTPQLNGHAESRASVRKAASTLTVSEEDGLERGDNSRVSLRKASSTPVIPGDEKKSKKILRAFKPSSFRSTIRGNKHRPSVLPDGTGDSPFVAGDMGSVRLTAVKGKNMEKDQKRKAPVPESVNRENFPPKPRITTAEDTPKLPHKQMTKHASPKSPPSARPKQTKPLPPVPDPQFDVTPRTSKKRESQDPAPPSSLSKKKRTSSPREVPIQPVRPRRKTDGFKHDSLNQEAALGHMYDSKEEASKMFECMIHPVKKDKFFKELWQKKPLLVRRHISSYNDGWFSTAELDRILAEEHIEFGVNLDVTSYQNGKRETLNAPGRAYRATVWDHYQNGCSVRMLNPQTYSKNVWNMLSVLQEFFGCCAGANVYLTPPGTQGFAPHYDDIEAFILQLEGQKHWRLYNPRSEEETLPRTSSGNFDESEIGSPILEVTLKAGDLLYMPRGTIHQGRCLEDDHSLHITFSCYQKNTWGDLLEIMVPRALNIAIEEDVTFREGLPTDYLHYMGLVNSDLESSRREAFVQKMTQLMTTMVENYLPIDAACDQMGKKYIQDSLPPVLTESEKACSVHGHGEKWDDNLKCVQGTTEVEPDTMIKLIRKGAIRVITEDDMVRIYHNLENARVYHGRETQYIEISAEAAPAVEYLIHNYPEFTEVDSLPMQTTDERVAIASTLYEKGLLVTGEPLDTPYHDMASDAD